MSNETKLYNYRQISLMKTKIEAFKKGNIGVYDLITDLAGLLQCIQNCNKDWVETFRSQLGMLDTVYANTIYESRTTYTQQEQNLIDESIKKIYKLIEVYKQENFIEEPES
jgi:hypothetical protein